MEIFPAIDLYDGNAVRLFQGDYTQKTLYANNPLDMVSLFKSEGARNLHVVDLNAAKDGTLANFDTIRRIAAESEVFLQVGGGIRTLERIEKYLALGVNRVILGTAAVQDFSFVKNAVAQFQEAVAVGIDAKNGFVAINGWCDTTAISSVNFCKQCAEAGVQTIIYTDIAKDGALMGTNLVVYDELAEIKGLQIVASGGVSFLHEIEYLAQKGVYGAIVGKAIYEKKLSLAACIKAAQV